MAKNIYGVDLSKPVTSIIARESVINCFKKAHSKVLEQMKEFLSFKTKKEFDRFKELDVRLLIKSKFDEVGGNYDNPTKKDLIAVCDALVEYASNFRQAKTIKKHYDEIMPILDRLD